MSDTTIVRPVAVETIYRHHIDGARAAVLHTRPDRPGTARVAVGSAIRLSLTSEDAARLLVVCRHITGYGGCTSRVDYGSMRLSWGESLTIARRACCAGGDAFRLSIGSPIRHPIDRPDLYSLAAVLDACRTATGGYR